MRTLAVLSALLFAGCDDAALVEHDYETPALFEGGKELLDVAPDYRSVGYESRGPLASGLSATTRVWQVSRDWDDVTNEAGVAWQANSGLTWDEKYAAWLDAMETTQSDDYHQTIELITPWGRKIASPRLECAELAMFLRVTFASWYELPFFMSAYSSTDGTIYSGHFGIVNSAGRKIDNTPRYGSSYTDYTADFAGRSNSYILANWPHDNTLASKYLTSSKDDYNEFLGADKYAGAYFDEVFLNKRVGYFLLRLLTWHGSMHLASANNMYNLDPHDIREGDVLLHRWQSNGIGHTMVLKEVDELGGGNLDAEFVFGSMPRIQPKWYNATVSKSYFTSSYAGSGSQNSAGETYSHLGGGIKRWRSPTLVGGYWTNIVLSEDRDAWIGSTNYSALEGRIATFEEILGDLTPAEERDAYLDQIELARDALRHHPSSCTNRIRREDAFEKLYDVMSREFGMGREQVDRQYRILDDYVFAELEYTDSKTCCWNSTTEAMADIVLQYNTEKIEDADDNNQCFEPVVFKARNGGTYSPFAAYATSIGRGSEWVAWSADESCPQSGVSEDLEVSPLWTDFCDIEESVMGWNACPNGGAPRTWYLDDDGDGHGDARHSTEACTAPSDYVSSSDDCDDDEYYVHPGATEYCDDVDNDCDGQADENCDGTSIGGSSGGTDCSIGCDGSLVGPGLGGANIYGGVGLLGLFWRRRRRVF